MLEPAVFRLTLIGALLGLPPLAIAPCAAEMLQFATPDGVKSWPKLADIPEWHQDMESSLKLGANSLIPDGVDPATAEATIQARGFPRSGVISVSQMVESDRAGAPAGTEVRQLTDVADKDGVPFKLYSFAPPPQAGNWKATAYSEEGDHLLAFTLSARSKAAYESNLPVFVALIQKYAKDIPW
jgi:hypothetical protein